ATSVGITARVLSDIGKLETPEGVTILGGAVVDDVLGILVLAIVVGIERSGAVSAASVLVTTVKAVGVWLGITGLSLLLAGWIERAFERVRYSGARVGLGLALAFFCAGLAEMFGLAFIIGAYSVGLGLSRTKMAQQLVEDLQAVYDFIVPVFFAAMGMLVNYSAMAVAVAFGIVLSLWAIVSKIFGCGLPALMWFNLRGAARIGMGMLPRGEVALIVAGVGLAERAIDQSIFGVSIMMTLITTIIAPLALVPLFRGAPGRRGEVAPERPPEEPISIEMPRSVSTNFVRLLLVVFQERGFELRYGDPDEGIYQLERGDLAASIRDHDGRVIVQVSAKGHACVEQIVQEAEARLIEAVRQIHEIPPPGNGAPSEPNPTASGRR
ncbi:MAG: cation:proton antiporter, partial [Phycisphaerae bacterium]